MSAQPDVWKLWCAVKGYMRHQQCRPLGRGCLDGNLCSCGKTAALAAMEAVVKELARAHELPR